MYMIAAMWVELVMLKGPVELVWLMAMGRPMMGAAMAMVRRIDNFVLLMLVVVVIVFVRGDTVVVIGRLCLMLSLTCVRVLSWITSPQAGDGLLYRCSSASKRMEKV